MTRACQIQIYPPGKNPGELEAPAREISPATIEHIRYSKDFFEQTQISQLLSMIRIIKP